MIRVLLAEDQPMVRSALAALLALEDDIEVLGTVADGQSCLHELRRRCPDILLTDIEMPFLGGLEVAEQCRRMSCPCHVVVLTTFGRSGYLLRAMSAGVSGYLRKDLPAQRLAAALREVHAGGRVIDPALAAEPPMEPDPFASRERQVLRMAGRGFAAAAIARQLCLSQQTVHDYLATATRKMGAFDQYDAYRAAHGKGWL